MTRLIGTLMLLVAVTAAQAHPGVGIVQDSRGNIFFTDLRQVWKVAPDGRKSVAVPDVHSHELCLDADDNLYGEHLSGEGGKWRHRVWRLTRDGSLSDVIPARDGFLRDDSFVRDKAGNRYWTEAGGPAKILKRSTDGRITTLATADLRAIGRMTVTADGTLFLIASGNLHRVTPDGKVMLVAARLSEHSPPPAEVAELNYHMGIWSDAAGNAYVAVARERLVLQVRPDGSKKVAARSGDGWSPSGGMFDRDGNLWLLEYDAANAVRIRRTSPPGSERVILASDP
ncbi:MAG TPA: hypothetical protein VFB80_12000 [Pirellulaceae bacterium]|nr:hypothetical protein [Pirellulaceae bacterium]